MREEGHVRVNPGISNPRYYYLRQLRKAMEEVVSLYLRNAKALKLVDYGCGNTPYKPMLSPYVGKYLGADLAENPRADIKIDPVGEIALPSGETDIVLSTQVLEHVVDPNSYLAEANRVLKQDGLLILSTHGYWMYHPDPTDYWRWTSAGLKKIIEAQGFEVIHFRGILNRMSMGLQLFQDGIMFKLPSPLRPIVTLPLQLLISGFDRLGTAEARDADACTFMVVARKVKSVG